MGWLGVCAVDQSTNVDDNQDDAVVFACDFWAIVKEEGARDRRSIISQQSRKGSVFGMSATFGVPGAAIGSRAFLSSSAVKKEWKGSAGVFQRQSTAMSPKVERESTKHS